MTHPHRAPELRPPCAPGTLARPTRAGRARSGTDGVGRAPPRRAATGDVDKNKERDVLTQISRSLADSGDVLLCLASTQGALASMNRFVLSRTTTGRLPPRLRGSPRGRRDGDVLHVVPRRSTASGPTSPAYCVRASPSTSVVRRALGRKRGTSRGPGTPRSAPSDRRPSAPRGQWHRRRR